MGFRDEVPEEAKCNIESAILCDYITTFENEEVLIERCRFCNKRLMFNKYDGAMDNSRHLQAHMRDSIQPFGRTGKLFEAIYGIAHVTQNTKENEKRFYAKRDAKDPESFRAEARDIAKTLKQKTFL